MYLGRVEKVTVYRFPVDKNEKAEWIKRLPNKIMHIELKKHGSV